MTPPPVTPALTLEEIDELEARFRDYGSPRLLHALSMARRLVELESALAFIENGYRPVRCLLADEILKDARELGWSPAKVEGR